MDGDTREAGPAEVVEENLLAFLPQIGCLPSTRFQEEAGLRWFESGLPSPVFNQVLATRLEPEEADARLARLLDRFRTRRARACWWECPGSRPGDLGRRLTAQGMALAEEWTGMTLELAQREPFAPEPAGFEVRPVPARCELRDWMRVFTEGFAISRAVGSILLDAWSGRLRRPDAPFRLYLGLQRGEPAATAMLMTGREAAGLYCIATLPRLRRRGIGAAMTDAALREAEALGFREAVLQATPMGVGIYQRLGFRACCSFGLYMGPL